MSVCVLGSMNMDLVVNVDKMPRVGETIMANEFKKVPGGKGANQAVAAARLGTNVYMIAKIGKDDNGEILLEGLNKDNINTDKVFVDDKNPTGMAIISVDSMGNNMIEVIAGSNMKLTVEDIKKCEDVIKSSKILIAQFETPKDVTYEAFKIARENGVITILNPAPAGEIGDDILSVTDIIIPNETETYELTNVKAYDLETAKEASKTFLNKKVKYVIITLGEKGAFIGNSEKCEIVPAYKVNAVDTTAAGDAFIGGVSKILHDEGKIDFEIIKRAVRFGNMVSSIVVTRKGAQTSIPVLDEVTKVYGEDF